MWTLMTQQKLLISHVPYVIVMIVYQCEDSGNLGDKLESLKACNQQSLAEI